MKRVWALRAKERDALMHFIGRTSQTQRVEEITASYPHLKGSKAVAMAVLLGNMYDEMAADDE